MEKVRTEKGEKQKAEGELIYSSLIELIKWSLIVMDIKTHPISCVFKVLVIPLSIISFSGISFKDFRALLGQYFI